MKSWSERASLVGGAGIFTGGRGGDLHWWVGQESSLVGGAGSFTGGQGRELPWWAGWGASLVGGSFVQYLAMMQQTVLQVATDKTFRTKCPVLLTAFCQFSCCEWAKGKANVYSY